VRDALLGAPRRARLTLVVGVGNLWRGDDGAGPAVVRRMRELGTGVELREVDGDAAGLVDAWAGHEWAALVDAASSGASPGTLHAYRADRDPLPDAGLRSSTHAFGVADAIELARALGRLPARLDVYAVEGAGFAVGAALSPAAARAVDELAARLVRAGA
jgi:hydrogenase maturation protease